MQATLHALSWGLTRLGLVVAALLLTVFFLFATIVTVMVAIEAAKGFGQ